MKKTENHTPFFSTKPTHPIIFPDPELFQKKNQQKRITTLISTCITNYHG